MAVSTYKYLLLTLFVLMFTPKGFAQTYYQVTATSGIQVIGGVIVTVTPINLVGSQAICGVYPYRTWIGGYKFKFSNHVSHIRSHMMNINNGDTMEVICNGSQYYVTSADLSYYNGACAVASVTNSVITSNGYIVGTNADTSGVQFDASPATYMDSVEIDETNDQGAGVIFDFSFVPVCTNIYSAYSDTPCAGSTLHFTVSGPLGNTNTFSWTGPNNFTSSQENPTIPNVQLSGAGTYYLTAAIDTCTYHVAVNVIIDPSPPAPIIAATTNPLCIGDTLLLAASSASALSYSWSGPASFSSTSQNISVPNFAPADSGYYYATAYINGCSASSGIHVTLKPQPTVPSASSNGPLCMGGTLSLTAGSATPGVSYQWTGPNNFLSLAQNPNIVSVPLIDSGNYTVTTTLNGCRSSNTTHVVILSSPSALFAGSNSPVCQADTIKLLSGSTTLGVTYNWSGPNSFLSSSQNNTILNASPVNAGYYYLTASLNGCSVTDTVNVAVNPLPAAPTISGTTDICQNSSLNLSATSSSPGATYSWHGPNNFSSLVQNITINPVLMQDSGYFVANAILNGCKASDSVKVSVRPLPASVLASSNSPVCENGTLSFTASSASTGVNYDWYGPISFFSALQNPNISNAPVNASGNYLMVASLNGCNDTVIVPVIINPAIVTPPAITISAFPGDTICLGSNVTFTAVAFNAGPPTYQWMKNNVNISGATSASYSSSSLSNGDHISCEVTSNQPCQAINTSVSNTLTLVVESLPPPGLTITSYPAYTPGNPITFTGHITGNSSGLSFQWRKNGMDIVNATNSFYTTSSVNAGDTICLVVYSSATCTIPDSVIECVQVTVGISNLTTAMQNVRVYPDPVMNELIIEGGEKGMEYKIYNIVGQALSAGAMEKSKQSVNMSHFLTGTYILELTGNDGSRYIHNITKY